MTTHGTDADLGEFIRRAKTHGITDEFVVSLLRQNGWSDRRIFRAYSDYYGSELGVPVPSKHSGAPSARDAFYYLLNFIALGCWVVALGQVFYILIDHWLPDPASANTMGPLRDAIAWQVATVVVGFPLFAFMHNLIKGELKRRPDLYYAPERRNTTYLALVLAAIVVIGDAVWFVEGLIRGELTIKFILDALVLLILGGGVFTYYLRTMEPPASEA